MTTVSAAKNNRSLFSWALEARSPKSRWTPPSSVGEDPVFVSPSILWLLAFLGLRLHLSAPFSCSLLLLVWVSQIPYSFLHKPIDLGHIEIIHYIYYCRQETLRRNWVAITVNKSLKCSPWIQSQERQNDLCSYPRQTIQYHSNPSLCPNQ